ncbi:helix-turn-helix domain-containing protein [Photobacterium toruni]|uniref:Bacteriophage CI repressor helix-turn-helix domain protein n=1 Tax=Photobacterium toruni TaxID=1935446 RepID=A0A1T4PUI4_9GAMM|nr:helix-turn-helix domain-containing protein [Photobacterium toruni]SJZ95214.1 Bacteriophage CI repressor helix-turn-helix domain protein [Photobacterium toruni]
MTISQPEIKTFNYTGGKDFTTRLLTVTGASNLKQLAQIIGVPRTTISTWHQRDMIQHEIIVRICLATGASLKYLALGEGEPFDTEQTSSDTYPDLNINSTPVLELIKDQPITKIPQFPYDGGRSITKKLKILANVEEFQDLAEVFDIPRSTISTWHTRNMTPFEVILRTHLATGCSLKWLMLDQGEAFEKTEDSSIKTLPIEKISNGSLETKGHISLDLITLEKYGLEESTTTVVEQDHNFYFVNTFETNPTSGRYLIDIDGSLSINHLQRLPGKKLAMDLGSSTIEVAQEDIKVIGRVAIIINKE